MIENLKDLVNIRMKSKMKKFWILIVLISLIPIMVGCENNQLTVKKEIDHANYVRVELPDSGVDMYVNLAANSMYGAGLGVKEDTIYAYKETFFDKSYGFRQFKKVDMFYPVITDKITVDEVKQSNFKIIKNINNKSSQSEIISAWHGNGYKGNKIKIFYNHDCLPIKVQMVKDNTNKWKTIVKYSYFKSTPQKYERNWKNYVKKVKAGYFLDE